MTDEELNRKFDTVADHLAALAISQQKSEARIDRLERVLLLAIRAGQRERKETRGKTNALEATMAKLAEAQVQLAESQAHADRRLDALIDIVQGGKQ